MYASDLRSRTNDSQLTNERAERERDFMNQLSAAFATTGETERHLMEEIVKRDVTIAELHNARHEEEAARRRRQSAPGGAGRGGGGGEPPGGANARRGTTRAERPAPERRRVVVDDDEESHWSREPASDFV